MPGNQPRPASGSGHADLVRSSAISAATWGIVLVAVGLGAFLLWQLRVVLALVFVAILLAAATRSPVGWLQGRGLPRIAAVLLIYLAIALVAGLGIWLIVPPLVEQASDFIANLPETVEALLSWVRSTFGGIIPGDAVQQAIDGVRSSFGQVLPGIQSALQVPLVVVGVLVNVVLIIFLSIFLLLDGRSMWLAILGYFHPDTRNRADAVGETIMGKLGAYVIGQLVIMSFTGMGAVIGMLIIGVPYVLPLGFLAFVTEAIPLVGPWIGGMPIVAVAFAQSPLQGLLMAGWILLLQQVEGYVLVPFVQRRAIQVSATIVLLAVVAGGTIAGVLGALIAIPLVAASQVFMNEVILPARRRTWQGGGGQARKAPASAESASD